jgi:hypothetical protein
MKESELNMSELPARLMSIVEKEFVKWEVYQPTTIEADIPFGKDWYKYAYWMPKIKKDFYRLAISRPEAEITEYCIKLGFNPEWFEYHYNEFLKLLKWMRKNNKFNHLGEV